MYFLWMMLLGTSFAQDESEEVIEKAKQAYKYGEQLFNEGNYPEAIKAFLRAYELTHRYQLLYNLALSYQFSADLEKARHYFEEYQRLAPAEQWNEAQQRIDNIDAILKSREEQESEDQDKETSEQNPPTKKTIVIKIPWWASPVMWGVGTAGVAGGLHFGIKSQAQGELALNYCQEGLCIDKANDFISSSKTSAVIADVAWGVGLTAIGGALWLHVNKKSKLSVTPSSVVIRGVF